MSLRPLGLALAVLLLLGFVAFPFVWRQNVSMMTACRRPRR